MDNLGGYGGLYDVYFGLKIRNMKDDILKNFWIQALHDDDHDREDRFFVFLQIWKLHKDGTTKFEKSVFNTKFADYAFYIKEACLYSLEEGHYIIRMSSFKLDMQEDADQCSVNVDEAERNRTWCLRLYGMNVKSLEHFESFQHLQDQFYEPFRKAPSLDFDGCKI